MGVQMCSDRGMLILAIPAWTWHFLRHMEVHTEVDSAVTLIPPCGAQPLWDGSGFIRKTTHGRWGHGVYHV